MQTAPSRWQRLLAVGLLALTGLAFALLLASRVRELWPFTVDDTFITLQYAKHLARGMGPVWNVDGPRVEGYTSALWLVLLALPELLGSHGPGAAKVGSVLFAVLSVLLASALAYLSTPRESQASRCLAAATPFALGAAYWKLAVHAVSGMETTLTASLLVGFACLLVRVRQTGRARDARWLALVALLATLARPEAAVAAGTSLVALALALDPPARRLLLRACLAFTLLPGLVYFVTRYIAFGLLFPLPFYVKATGHGSFAGLPHVLTFLSDFVVARPVIASWCALGALTERRLLAPAVWGAAAFVLFFLFPRHIMGFESRYLMPVLPLVLALCGVGLAGVLGMVQRALKRVSERRIAALFAWAVMAANLVGSFPAGYPTAVQRWRAYGEGVERAHFALAQALRLHKARAPRPVIAMLDVGVVAYYSDWKVIDTFGLNDERVALSKRTDLAYVFSHEPELLVLVSLVPDQFEAVFDWEVGLAREAERRGYRAVRSYPFESDYHLRVLAKPGSAVGEALAEPSATR
jgi:arabinofuranosyltransferase